MRLTLSLAAMYMAFILKPPDSVVVRIKCCNHHVNSWVGEGRSLGWLVDFTPYNPVRWVRVRR